MSFINTFHYNKPVQSFVQKVSVNASQNQAYNPVANVLYTAGGVAGAEPINIYDANSLQNVGTFLTSSDRTRGIIYNPYNNRIYVQSNPLPTGITTTFIYDCSTLQRVGTIPSDGVNARYRGLATPDYTFIPYGTGGNSMRFSGGFYKINNVTGVVDKIGHGGGWGQTCAWDSYRNRLWIPCQSTIYNYLLIYDLNTNTTVFQSTNEGKTNPPFYGFMSTINAYDEINDVVYMSEEYSGTLYKLNAETGARISSASMGADTQPGYSIAFNDDKSEIYSTCSTKFQVWDAATLTEKYSIPIGSLGGNASVIKRKDGSLAFINNNGLFEPIIN